MRSSATPLQQVNYHDGNSGIPDPGIHDTPGDSSDGGHLEYPLPVQTIYPYRIHSGIVACNVATYCLINSRRRMTICSGRITEFLGIIVSPKKGVEAKLVQPGPLRAPILKGVFGKV